MKAVTSSEMKTLDRLAIEKYGIPSLLLMENAGRGIAEFIFHLKKTGRVTVFAGKGNNGGDGFVAARHLFNRGFQVYVILLAAPDSLKDEAALNFKILLNMKIPVEINPQSLNEERLAEIIGKTDIVVDAIFGVGLERPVEGLYRTVMEAINDHAKTVVAVDIPSGLNADTGEVMGRAVCASHTATLALPKKGLLIGRGPEYSGKICVVDIGIPKPELDRFKA